MESIAISSRIVALQRGERDRARTLNEDALVLARQ